MKKAILILILALQSMTLLCAQPSDSNTYQTALYELESAPITATLYVNEFPTNKEQFTSDWARGEVVFVNGTIAKNSMLRYNCWKDELIWLRDSDFKRGTVIKSLVKEFNIENKRFINYYDSIGLIKQNIYLEILTEGNIAFYCHRKVSYIKSSNTFTNKHQFYLKKDGDLIKVKLRKSSFLNLFTEIEQKEFKSILRENKIKFKDEYQVARAIELFNKRF